MRCACCTISRVPSASVTASSRRPTAILVWTADPVLRRRRLRSKRVEIASPIGRRKWLLGSFPEGPFGFPVIAIRFPVSSPEVPCYANQGKASQLIESQERRARKIRFSSAFLEIFPVISRKTGKISDETGSYATARATTHSEPIGDFLALRGKRPNWRGPGHAWTRQRRLV